MCFNWVYDNLPFPTDTDHSFATGLVQYFNIYSSIRSLQIFLDVSRFRLFFRFFNVLCTSQWHVRFLFFNNVNCNTQNFIFVSLMIFRYWYLSCHTFLPCFIFLVNYFFCDLFLKYIFIIRILSNLDILYLCSNIFSDIVEMWLLTLNLYIISAHSVLTYLFLFYF